jgi:hypothetical protein
MIYMYKKRNNKIIDIEKIFWIPNNLNINLNKKNNSKIWNPEITNKKVMLSFFDKLYILLLRDVFLFRISKLKMFLKYFNFEFLIFE